MVLYLWRAIPFSCPRTVTLVSVNLSVLSYFETNITAHDISIDHKRWTSSKICSTLLSIAIQLLPNQQHYPSFNFISLEPGWRWILQNTSIQGIKKKDTETLGLKGHLAFSISLLWDGANSAILFSHNIPQYCHSLERNLPRRKWSLLTSFMLLASK